MCPLEIAAIFAGRQYIEHQILEASCKRGCTCVIRSIVVSCRVYNILGSMKHLCNLFALLCCLVLYV